MDEPYDIQIKNAHVYFSCQSVQTEKDANYCMNATIKMEYILSATFNLWCVESSNTIKKYHDIMMIIYIISERNKKYLGD